MVYKKELLKLGRIINRKNKEIKPVIVLDFDMTINVEKTLLEEIFVDYEYYSNYL